jgi:hypothetical protein
MANNNEFTEYEVGECVVANRFKCRVERVWGTKHQLKHALLRLFFHPYQTIQGIKPYHGIKELIQSNIEILVPYTAIVKKVNIPSYHQLCLQKLLEVFHHRKYLNPTMHF